MNLLLLLLLILICYFFCIALLLPIVRSAKLVVLYYYYGHYKSDSYSLCFYYSYDCAKAALLVKGPYSLNSSLHFYSMVLSFIAQV